MKFFRCLSISLFATALAFVSSAQAIKGNYAIKNLSTGLLLRPLEASNRNETPIVGYSPVNWKCMTWDFKQVSANVYCLRNLLTNKTFQPSAVPQDGVTLYQQPMAVDNVNQQWEFLPASKDAYQIRLKGTDLYVTAVKDEINSNIILAKKRGDQSQRWTIYEQDPKY